MPNRTAASGRQSASGRASSAGRASAPGRFATVATYNRAAVAPALQAARAARVDLVGVGDSNQAHMTDGWDWGWKYALDLRLGLYATHLCSQQEKTGFGVHYGGKYRPQGWNNQFAWSGAPAALDAYMNFGSGGLLFANYAYLAGGSSYTPAGTGFDSGLRLLGSCGLDVTAPLIFSLNYGTFTTGSGSFQAGVAAGATVLAQSSLVSTNTGANTMQRVDVQISADATRAGQELFCSVALSGQAAVTGPYFGTFYRVSNPNRTAGASFTSFDCRASQPLRVMATDAQQCSAAFMAHFFGELRRLQGATKRVIVVINSGNNDIGDTVTSVGPSPAESLTPAGFADNAQALVNVLTGVWSANSWPASELYFVIMVSHPISTPDNSAEASYRVAARGVADANPRTCAVDLTQITNAAVLAQNNWYYVPGSDLPHLSRQGYQALALAALDDLLAS